MNDDMELHEDRDHLAAIGDVAKKISQGINTPRSLLVQAKITGLTSGPPRTATIDIGGTTVSGVSMMDHVDPTLNEGVWLMDNGGGQWLIIGVAGQSFTRAQFVRAAGDTMTGTLNGTSISLSGSLTVTQAAGAAISLTGATSKWVTFGSAGIAPPSFTTRSVGSKLVLYENIGAANAGWAIGIDSSTMWFGGDTTGSLFKFYGGTTLAAQITGTGVMTLFGPTNETLRLVGTNAFISFYDNANTTRVGYLQGVNGNDLRLAADIGQIILSASTLSCYSTGVAALVSQLVSGTGWSTAGRYLDNRTGAVGTSFITNAWPSSGSWTVANIVINGAAGGGSTANFVTMSMNPFNVAPMLRCHATNGERLESINNSNTAFAPMAASAFPIGSTITIKNRVQEVEDDELLEKISNIKTHRYHYNARPGVVRPSARFKDINDRWVAKGKSPLMRQVHHFESHDHDCAIDECAGTAENPCRIIKSSTPPRMGLIAEYVHPHFPEITNVDDDGNAVEIEVDQVAATALGGVSALVRRMQALEAVVASITTGGKP